LKKYAIIGHFWKPSEFLSENLMICLRENTANSKFQLLFWKGKIEGEI
jgi:hypothetical protein